MKLTKERIKLLFTQDGKEYLTPEQLDKEIIALIEENGGKMDLKTLASHIGVGLELVEAAC